MNIKQLARKKHHLFWHVKDPGDLSPDAVLEGVLNYGDFDDVKKVVDILGVENASRIFTRQLRQKRKNYPVKIANYFKLYFKKYSKNT